MKPFLMLLPALALFSYAAPVEKPKAAPLQVFHAAGELSKSEDNGLIDITIPFIALDQRLKLTFKDHHKEKIPDKGLWGFSDAEGTLFRYFGGTWEEVVAKENDLVIYSHPAKYGPVYSFSKGFDGTPYGCRLRNLKKIGASQGDFSTSLIDKYF